MFGLDPSDIRLSNAFFAELTICCLFLPGHDVEDSRRQTAFGYSLFHLFVHRLCLFLNRRDGVEPVRALKVELHQFYFVRRIWAKAGQIPPSPLWKAHEAP